MREIQDLTLHVERGLAAIEGEFARSTNRFHERLRALLGSRSGFGIRVTGVPIVPVWIEKLQRNPAAHLPMARLFGVIEKSTYEVFVPAHHIDWRPTLRGIEGRGGTDEFKVELSGRANGFVDYCLMVAVGDTPETGTRALYPGWVMGLVANCICGIEKYRRLAEAVETEYGLELELMSSGPLRIGKYGGTHFGDYLGPFPGGQTLFPRYSLGSADEFQQLAALIERDFWNTAGHAWDSGLLIDFKRALNDLGL